ncbi:MAG: prepilin-type N-terminal cleavage/methylation domain-containing protein [Candidatus Wallbacteria bacterium]|nr:prepilin-type N-terminal cleavage/methylation domain-containing protein [Candidatus Wallbacteria bacterium]
MNRQRKRQGFTIIELLIVVIVIGVLASAGLAKYQNFAETSRRKACVGQLHTLETGMAVWETNNTAFAENSKCAFGFTVRAGRLTDTAINPALLAVNTAPASLADAYTTVGAPTNFYNTGAGANGNIGPLNTVIRDDNVWDCPSAGSRYYAGEVQNIPDDYMDTSGAGVSPPAHAGAAVGLGGRYFGVVLGRGNGSNTLSNGGFPNGWIFNNSVATNVNSATPCPQPPFKIMICGCYGTFGTGTGTSNVTGTSNTNQGGPVGPDGSALSRHSTRW